MLLLGFLAFSQIFGIVVSHAIPKVGSSFHLSSLEKRADLFQTLEDTLGRINKYTETEGSIYLQKGDESRSSLSIPINLQVYPPGMAGKTTIAQNIMNEQGCEGNVVIMSSKEKEPPYSFQAGLCISINRDMNKPKVHLGEFSVSGASNMELRQLWRLAGDIDLHQDLDSMLAVCFNQDLKENEKCLKLDEINHALLPFKVLSKRELDESDGPINEVGSILDHEKGKSRLVEMLEDFVGESINHKISEKFNALSGHDLKRVYDWKKEMEEAFDDSLQYSFQRIDKDYLVKRDDSESMLAQEADIETDSRTSDVSISSDPEQGMPASENCYPVTWFNIFRHSVFGTHLCQQDNLQAM